MQLLLLLPPLGDDLQLHAAAALAASDRLLEIQEVTIRCICGKKNKKIHFESLRGF